MIRRIVINMFQKHKARDMHRQMDRQRGGTVRERVRVKREKGEGKERIKNTE